MKDNIILIGMPGVGKSTVGVVLAKAIGYDFMDADLVIQQQTGKLLCELIEELGTEGFIRLENEINSKIDVQKTVIATGGSAVYGSDAMAHYKEIGTVVYLKTSYDELCDRLGDLKDRGVVLRDGQSLRDIYEERSILYERYADVTVSEDGLSIRQTIECAKRQLGI